MRGALIFIAKWALAGLAFALALVWLRPDLRRAPIPIAPQARALTKPDAGAPPVDAKTPIRVDTYAEAVSKSAPAVVNIYSERLVAQRAQSSDLQRLFGDSWPGVQQRVEASLGSGVILDGQGHVVTNNHLIEKATQIKLQLADGRVADADVVGKDPESDLAVLRIKIDKLPVMKLGRSDKLRIGDVVLAIGNPYGLQQTVTHGIVSAVGRDMRFRSFESFIQTDAAINLGNSGGALVNVEGELIGINTATLGQSMGAEGIGFAIPVDMVRGVAEQIIKHGRVRRGWLGVNSQPVSPQLASALGIAQNIGVQLIEVFPDSPAARAGLQPGDVILTLNGVAVHDPREAMSRVAALSPGRELHVQARRAAESLDIRVKVEERPKDAAN